MNESHHNAPEPIEQPPYCDRCGFYHTGRCESSPRCPSCRHINALLYEWKPTGNVLKCRDCGYEEPVK